VSSAIKIVPSRRVHIMNSVAVVGVTLLGFLSTASAGARPGGNVFAVTVGLPLKPPSAIHEIDQVETLSSPIALLTVNHAVRPHLAVHLGGL